MKYTEYQNKCNWLCALLLLGSLCLAMTSCLANHQGDPENTNAVAAVLHQDTQGMRMDTAPSAVWIQTKEELDHFYTGLKALKLSDTSKPAPEIDFKKNRVLLVEMGQKPTGGYSLQLIPAPIQVSGGTARIGLQWTEPEPQATVPQVITSPTLLLTVGNGDYTSVEILDQHGRVLFNLSVVD